ncbi:lysophospholipase catalytic domain-containing protein [Staphylotrichum tortipilum]|uniref:Lysophospholipase n=1 Tax=Staphylotrichum tortipilum TaxID=2831512 RepID=A0AAN6MUS6_9PEZI|nr:lysophospholipase catalytic domain-containing protein [Staphylotrichum longicolle]
MHHPLALLPLALLPFTTTTSAEPVRIPPQQQQNNNELIAVPRALPDAPSGGYAPAQVPCPATKPSIRRADVLSKNETDWLAKRRPITVDPMIDFLKRANIEGFDAEAYIKKVADGVKDLPNIAIAVSGGGYRALMNGAGFVAAADSRTTDSTAAGGIGGLLQATTYFSGLSGGGWLVTSIYANNYSSVQTLRDGHKGSSIWDFDNSIFKGPDLPGILDTARYWKDVAGQVKDKITAGFDASITDYWGRALSFQLVDAPDGGPAYTFSSISEGGDFSNARAPFPILVADGRAPGEKIISLNATVYEFNPFEMGSWDPTTFGFAPIRYLASNFSGGVIPSGGKCVRGFDSVSYVFGTSSSLFNAFLLQNISSVSGVPDFLLNAATDLLEGLDKDKNDIAVYAPNPFLGWNNDTNPSADALQLDLVDGGMDLQNIPLHPLIQPARAVDVIFAVDSSADTTFSWPNGTALRATYDRTHGAIANGTLFPPVPDDVTFVALGLNNRPTFFGCDVKNFTLSAGQTVPPLVVYVPNAPYSAVSNFSTFKPSYTDEERNGMIRNGYDAGTQGNATLDARWPACVACAVMSRSWARTGTAVPAECSSCFERYCWNGTTVGSNAGIVSGAGGEEYQPAFKIGGGDVSTKSAAAGGFGVGRSVWALLVGLVVAVVVL